MSIFFNKVKRGNSMNPTAPKKWYATLKTVNRIDEKDVAKLVADETTLNRKEAEMALTQFEKILLRLLSESHSVQLGDWGSFHLTCNSLGSATKDEVTANNIKNLNIRFVPGKDLKEALKKVDFVFAESITTKSE